MARTDAFDPTEVDPAVDYDSVNVEAEPTDEAVFDTGYEAAATEAQADAVAEAPAEPVADPEAEAAAAELEKAIEESVQAFKNLALATAAEADDEGHLNPDQLSPLVSAYRDVEGGNKGKKQARDFIVEQMKGTLTSGAANSFQLAMAWNTIQDAIQTAPTKSSGGGGKSTATPVSQTQLYADKIASLRLALTLAEANVPEGVDDNWEDKVTGDFDKASALYEFVSTEQADDAVEPEASPIEKAAVKLATGRGPRKAGRPSGAPYQGTRRDVAAHIVSAFADKPSGTFLSVAEIKAAKSEEYGEDSPSSGAISARLFPKAGPDKMTVPGIAATSENGKNGARKL